MNSDQNKKPMEVSNLDDPAAVTGEPAEEEGLRGLTRIWDRLVRLGLGEPALRLGTGVASLALILIVVWVMTSIYLHGQRNEPQSPAQAATLPTATAVVATPIFDPAAEARLAHGITRDVLLHTTLPSRPRFDLTTYTVQKGDTIIGIAEKFSLDPRTILWGNYDTLYDNPEYLSPDQVLNILPQDGVLYTWHTGDGLNGVAKFFDVSVDDIIDWPGNKLNREALGDLAAPSIADGTKLFIPGGKRDFISWDAPRVTRENPGVAKSIGSGVCGQITGGLVGIQTFLWPTTEHFLSGYHFSPETNHPAIDIGGSLGNAIYATDNGVVVYAGWSDAGYGNLIIIDHGNGWQSLYAHLSQIYVSCGDNVYQGATIGLMGSTGRSSGPHLHFELRSDVYGKVDPMNYTQ